jgi:hypothetical protein
MNRTEHLLANLAEEAAELNKECMKALRFGLDGCYPDGKTNAERIMIEYAHVVGVMSQLLRDNVLNAGLYDGRNAEDKRLRMLEFIKGVV